MKKIIAMVLVWALIIGSIAFGLSCLRKGFMETFDPERDLEYLGEVPRVELTQKEKVIYAITFKTDYSELMDEGYSVRQYRDSNGHVITVSSKCVEENLELKGWG